MFSCERILVPVDFSGASRRAAEYAVFLARRLDASIELFHAWQSPQYVFPETLVPGPGWNWVELEAAIERDARNGMETFRTAAAPREVVANIRVVRGHPADAIVQRAKEGHFDAIVMGTHGRTALGRMLLGSVATATVAQAPCPVITVREEAAAARAG